MKVVKLSDILNTENDVDTETWNSRRLLLHKDKMGFSLHDTIIKAGTETLIHYQNHLEAVYCIEGAGEVELTEDGSIHKIEVGTMYALDQHDRHLLRATKNADMRVICVFNPPVTGTEVHNKDGVYAALAND